LRVFKELYLFTEKNSLSTLNYDITNIFNAVVLSITLIYHLKLGMRRAAAVVFVQQTNHGRPV